MNEHEIDRIAAAMNQLRPDWPAASLRTLLQKKLADRPRRDVAVALAWVACEANTSTPARVLETGPWWRAAAVEGQAQRIEVVTPDKRCGICAKPRARCEAAPRFADDDHVFEPDFRQSTGSAVDELRDIKAKTRTPGDGEVIDTDAAYGELKPRHLHQLRATQPTPNGDNA